MQVYSQALNLPAGQSMGGYGGQRLSSAASVALEVNGWQWTDANSGQVVDLCAIDALYAGDLVDCIPKPGTIRILAASHTHYAPMLDNSKPEIGVVSSAAKVEFERGMRDARRLAVAPDRCRIYRSKVPVPIYRRFDVPSTAVNRWLTAHAGMYPNPNQLIDDNLYIFEFGQADVPSFVLCYHACHPVSRHDRTKLSADYVEAIRRTVRERFGKIPCLFLLGCAGDVRPNFSRKRVSWLPRSRLNWRFEWPVHLDSETAADHAYAEAVNNAKLWQELSLNENPCHVKPMALQLKGMAGLSFQRLTIGGKLRFDFVPFEVSHLYHLDAQKKDPMHFIVSCADQTQGYLPHPTQLAAGGYEVDASRSCMNMAGRAEWQAQQPW